MLDTFVFPPLHPWSLRGASVGPMEAPQSLHGGDGGNGGFVDPPLPPLLPWSFRGASRGEMEAV